MSQQGQYSIPPEILATVRRIEIRTRRLVEEVFSGEYHSVFKGRGMEFAEVREDTVNLDETKLEALITPKTKAIVVVHYAGVACEMDAIGEIARRQFPIPAQGIRAQRNAGAVDLQCPVQCHRTARASIVIDACADVLLGAISVAMHQHCPLLRERVT